MQSILGRFLLLGGFTLVALMLFLPSTPLSSKLPSFLVDNVPKIVLGLDLQGGMHLVLKVDREAAVANSTQRLVDGIENIMEDRNVILRSIDKVGNSEIAIAYAGENSQAKVKKIMDDEFFIFSAPEDKDGKLHYKITEDEVERLKKWALSQALETIRNRIDKFGVTEPLVQRQGQDQIVVQLAGVKDTKRALELIGRTAILEFKMLDEENDPVEAEKFGAPAGSEILYQQSVDFITGEDIKTPYLVKEDAFMTGDLISDARTAFDGQQNKPNVSLMLNKEGAKIFAKVTEDNVGKRLAIILDGNVYSAPVINERIAGGQVSISGSFTYEEATDLAIVLRSGSLLAPVEIVQNVTVGPTLGKDSIDAGLKAVTLGGILVLVFMIAYYRVSGIIADIAITLNIIMLLGAMAWANATLTLPGIAGIILTIGMGVDSNVLIFERIKEELRAGRTPRSAINGGYNRAWWTIIDSHITTLITAVVLFQFGSGPIKGFAVALSLGILTNLFTALVGTKLAFDIQSEKFRIKKLSI